jgi:hypothetical protein
MYVRNGKSRAFATIEKITETQLRFFLKVLPLESISDISRVIAQAQRDKRRIVDVLKLYFRLGLLVCCCCC